MTLIPASSTTHTNMKASGTLVTARPRPFLPILPQELWTMILEWLPPSQLFSMYNVSRFMRSLSGPLLARVVAAMSPSLFFYQEYVRRIGIRLILEGVDLERDVVVFRPMNMEHQHRFRNELTLQCPQLEEITVSNLQEAPQVRRHKQHAHIFMTESTDRLKFSTRKPAPKQLRNRQRRSSSSSTDTAADRVFYTGSNFLDKACPLRAKRSGIATLDGTQHSFGKDYPWRLYYQIDAKPLPAASETKLQFHTGGLLLNPEDNQNVRQTIPSGGARFIRVVRFECSMNFLDPRRASRNVVGRWIAHKLQQCLRIFGATGSGYPLQHDSYHYQQQKQKHQASQKQQQPVQPQGGQETSGSSLAKMQTQTSNDTPSSRFGAFAGRRLHFKRSSSSIASQRHQAAPFIMQPSISDEYKIIECNDPQLSPNGELPMLHDGKNWISGTSRIISYMKRIGYDADEHLTPEQKAKVTAYIALIEEKLNDSILRKNAIRRVEKYGGHIRGHELIDIEHTAIYDNARDCYRALERMLGTQEFFLGDRPCSLDAMAFGYMSLQLFPEIPNPRFAMIITTQYPRLAEFCKRMRTECFANLPDPSHPTEESPFFSNIFSAGNQWFRNTFFTPKPVMTSAEEAEEEKTREKTPEEKDFELKRIYYVTFGVVAMVAYIIVNGLVVIGDEEDEEERQAHGGNQLPFMTELMEDLSSPTEDAHDDDD
ncbi:Metaxin-3 [Actinomortierella ambigua]|nr:Metaxin-3 [Actinomortierella ambigua]